MSCSIASISKHTKYIGRNVKWICIFCINRCLDCQWYPLYCCDAFCLLLCLIIYFYYLYYVYAPYYALPYVHSACVQVRNNTKINIYRRHSSSLIISFLLQINIKTFTPITCKQSSLLQYCVI